jgi:hypothetical protein
MSNVFDNFNTGSENTNFIPVFNTFFSRKLCLLWDNVEKYCTVRQTIYENIMQRRKNAIFMPDKEDKNIDTHSRYLLLIATWLIPSDLIKFLTSTLNGNWKSAQRLCHYYLFSQTVLLKKAMCKRTLFCFNAASDTSHEDTHTFHFCWRPKLDIKALSCNTQYFSIVNNDLHLNDTNRMHCCFSTAKINTRRRQMLHYASCASLDGFFRGAILWASRG